MDTKTAVVLDVKKLRTMSDYDIACSHCQHVFNGRSRIPCPKCGQPGQLQNHPAWVR